MRILHVRKINVPPKLYEELQEIAMKKSVTVDQIANDIIVAWLKRNTT